MKTETKNFDAVKMMRDIRDKMSHDIAGMTFEEIKAYFNKRKAAYAQPRDVNNDKIK